MTDIILRTEAIEAEIKKPWLEKTVTRYLKDMLRWMQYGYQFTEEQVGLLDELHKTVNG